MKLAAIIAAAVCLLIGLAIGVRRPCPCAERERQAAEAADLFRAADLIQPPDWPAAYWTTVGRA